MLAKMENVDFTCQTNGKGLWSKAAKFVRITDLWLSTFDCDGKNDAGHLLVYFNKKDWNISKDGLIYTDPLFEKTLKQELKKLGLLDDIGYSEQGMQGSNYVDFDVSTKFIKKFFEKVGIDSSECSKPSKRKLEEQNKKAIEDRAYELLQNLKNAANEYFEFLNKHNL